MKTVQKYWRWSLMGVLIMLLLPLGSCEKENEGYRDTAMGNFEALWHIIDTRYCFLDYKDIDWNSVYKQYRALIREDMTEEELFNTLGNMLEELRDGHVNLISSFNSSRYWKWFQDYPQNFDQNIVDRNYLQSDFLIAGGMNYKVMSNNIGYAYYGSFNSPVGETNLDYIMLKFASCDGMIIDIRNNGGGSLSNVNAIVGRFINEDMIAGYISHKTGPGHEEFSKPYSIVIESSNRLRYQKPVVVLTNRSCYSAANNFVSVMKGLPHVTIVGDRTGGGSGLPFSSELPNGWIVRFSASPIFNRHMEDTEFGILPDVYQNMEDEDMRRGIDSIIERAYQVIKDKS